MHGKFALEADELRRKAAVFELLRAGPKRRQPFGDPPGLDDFVEASIRQLRSRDDIATSGMTAAPAEIARTTVVATYFGGRKVFSATSP